MWMMPAGSIRPRVTEVWSIPSDPAEAESQLRALLHRARAARLRVTISGARHSMGDHTTWMSSVRS